MTETQIGNTERMYMNSSKTPMQKGGQIIGVLTEKFTQESFMTKGKIETRYKIMLPTGTEVITPGHAALLSKLDRVQIGKTVRIVYQGLSTNPKPGRMPAKLYDVFVNDAPAAVIQAPPAQPAPAPDPIEDSCGKILSELRAYANGVLDAPFCDIAIKTTGSMGAASEAVTKLKYEGRIYQAGGFWKAT